MLITQKCQYALHSLLFLAKHKSSRQAPVKIGHVAAEYKIPYRFLEVILHELKQGGFVESRRGADGGYYLALSADELRVGEIISFIDGPFFEPRKSNGEAPALRAEVFQALWKRADDKLFELFNNTTISDLMRLEQTGLEARNHSYQI